MLEQRLAVFGSGGAVAGQQPGAHGDGDGVHWEPVKPVPWVSSMRKKSSTKRALP